MSTLNSAQVLGSRFRASREADEITARLYQKLDLSSKGRFVRLAIGRSLGQGQLPPEPKDSDIKGGEVPARAVFKDEDVDLWIGLIISHSRYHGDDSIETMDHFRSLVRRHWQRGAALLDQDWQDADENYEKFVLSLISRRAHIDGVGHSGGEYPSIPLSRASEPLLDDTELLSKCLKEVGLSAEIRGEPIHGPRITRYRLFLNDVNQIEKLERKLREISIILNLQSGAPTLAKGDQARSVFLSVPRPKETWKKVTRDDFLNWASLTRSRDVSSRPVFLGLNELGEALEISLQDAPHLFVAGTTGSGKSVCLHSIIASLLETQPKGTIEFALIDPKQVEFSVYESLKSLYRGEVVGDAGKALELLEELVVEMESRYAMFKKRGVTNWQEAAGAGFVIPRIVLVVEELADLLFSKKAAEKPLTQLAQKARAAGIHIVLATQRPEAKTFGGLLRSNIPSRIALTVQKATESTIILDEGGAEDLLGAGDMLVKANGREVRRAHGALLDREFVTRIARRD